jgi:hypothetical protein
MGRIVPQRISIVLAFEYANGTGSMRRMKGDAAAVGA